MILSDAIEILEYAQSKHWKERMPPWMDIIGIDQTPLQSAPWLQRELATGCLQFRMVVGVQLVAQHHIRTTSMEHPRLVRPMAKADRGPIRFTLSRGVDTNH